MRKLNIRLVIALAVAMLASFTLNQAWTVSAQDLQPTGVVVEYLPGQSITIVDQNGTQHQYTISSSLKILPPVRANALAVGAFVTIIAPASLSQGKQMAVGIVVHPHIPPGWSVSSMSATAPATSTGVETFTALPTVTSLGTETATATETPTGTQLPSDTATATETPRGTETPADTPTTTTTPPGGGTTGTADAFIAWLRSLFQQILTSR